MQHIFAIKKGHTVNRASTRFICARVKNMVVALLRTRQYSSYRYVCGSLCTNCVRPVPPPLARKDTRWAGSISGGWVTTAGPHGSLTAPRSVCAAAPLPPASGPAHGRQPAITPATSSAAKLSGDVVGTTIMMPSEATVDYALSQPGGGGQQRVRAARGNCSSCAVPRLGSASGVHAKFRTRADKA